MSEPYVAGITGEQDCPHVLAYYHSAYQEDMENGQNGTYALCVRCGLHVWNVESPEGAEVFDLDHFYDGDFEDEDEDPDAPIYLLADHRALERWLEAVKDWQKS